MTQYNIPVLTGTRRTGNLSSRVAQYVVRRLNALGFVETPLLDLSIYDFPILEERLSHLEAPPPGLQEFSDILRAADALIIVSPEYKNGVPGGLKNALDYLPAGHLRHKPIGICPVTSGPYGGVHCLDQLRLICIALAGIAIPECFQVAHVQHAFDADGHPAEAAERTNERFDRFWKDLLWHTEATTERRKPR